MHPRGKTKPRGDNSLSERAYLSIRELILKGDLPIGSPLSRRKLASQLNMSVVPVSEALQRLEMESLVETRERAGTRVRVPTRVEIEEHYILREALESQAARLVAERASLQELQELRRMAEHVDILFDKRSHLENDREFLYTVHSQHAQFHMLLAECAHCSALTKAIENNHVLIHNWLYGVMAPPKRLPRHFHRDLVDGISSRDTEAADRAIRAHVQHGLEDLLGRIQAPESRKWREAYSILALP